MEQCYCMLPLLPRLDGENYGHWKIQMELMLKSRNLWEVVVPEEPEKPKSGEEKDERKNSEALFYIFRAVDEDIFQEISSYKSAKEAWDELEVR
uniref:DUF4219 domain-containing protein n=1 Tax=Nelumbo nucifera TaxID=4432 RepID=A0A822XLF1_NELNU|nr:TPA_asm: hypothetical protein HUJ06_023907 [Nelumbo nucifera]